MGDLGDARGARIRRSSSAAMFLNRVSVKAWVAHPVPATPRDHPNERVAGRSTSTSVQRILYGLHNIDDVGMLDEKIKC